MSRDITDFECLLRPARETASHPVAQNHAADSCFAASAEKSGLPASCHCAAACHRRGNKFLRFLLLNIASLDHSPDAIKAYEESLVLQFGLSTQESAAIHSAGQSLNTALAELRQSTKTLVSKPVLAPADVAELTSLNMQREQTIWTLANQILNSVSATTATRLRSPGHILAKPIAVK
jgi:hypothetical protein